MDEREIVIDENAKTQSESFSAGDWFKYASLPKQYLVDLSKNTRTQSSYSKYTREQLYTYLESPSDREEQLRNASIYFYNVSPHYRRLIQYYAYMPTWAYTISPVNFNSQKVKADSFKKQYLKVSNQLELMNIKHELTQATLIAYREGVYYGVIHSNNNSWFLQRIDPDMCQITSKEDGCWMYSIDCTKLRESELMFYPDAFTTLYNNYRATGQRLQEVPGNICFCLKADESSPTYSIPPWAAVLPLLYDIDNYKQLQEAASSIQNYKMLGLKIPLDDDGTPLISYEMIEKYYQHLCNALPEYIGAAAVPMDMTAYDFNNSAITSAVDEVTRSEEQYWAATGTSSLLFGSAKNTSASALKLSIHGDEEIVFTMLSQCERVINRLLKSVSSGVKFKINILPVTIYNQSDMASLYKDGSSYGLAKSSYAASLGIIPNDIAGMNYIEANITGMNELVPMSSTYTQSSSSSSGAGRPTAEESGTDLTEAGEQTREGDSGTDKTIV